MDARKEELVVANVLSRDLSLEAAVSDSPTFRANLQIYEDDIDELTMWLDSITKIFRNVLDSSSCKLMPKYYIYHFINIFTALNEMVKSLFLHGTRLHMIKEFGMVHLNGLNDSIGF